MYDRTGEKIQVVAIVMFVLGLIGSLILAIEFGKTVTRYDETFSLWKFLIILGAGAAGSYISSLFLSAFGELVATSARNAEQNEQLISLLQTMSEAKTKDTDKSIKYSNSKMNIGKVANFRMTACEEEAPREWVCRSCGVMNQPDAESCKYCGRNKK